MLYVPNFWNYYSLYRFSEHKDEISLLLQSPSLMNPENEIQKLLIVQLMHEPAMISAPKFIEKLEDVSVPLT